MLLSVPQVQASEGCDIYIAVQSALEVCKMIGEANYGFNSAGETLREGFLGEGGSDYKLIMEEGLFYHPNP